MDDFIIRPLLLLAVCHSRHSPITQPPRSNCVNIPVVMTSASTKDSFTTCGEMICTPAHQPITHCIIL